MEQRPLGRSGIMVSQLCLGTMTWGEQNSQEEGFAQMDAAVEADINFFDTAEMYAVPPTPKSYGTTETIIGHWFAARPGLRQKIVLASKVTGRSEGMPYIRGNPRLSRAHIEEAINNSLKRLQTDYLDLYQLHWPDRQTNYFGKLGYQAMDDSDSVPILETLEALNDLVKAGKVRHIGLSNETPWGTMKFLQLAETHGLPRAVSIQNPYSLLNRSYEVGLAEVSHREDIGLLAYSPLAFGVLTGKYLNGQWPEKARITLFKRFSRYLSPQAEAATTAYVALAREHGLSPAQMALAFINRQPFVTSNIIGATSLAQLQENIGSAGITLSDELLQAIEAIHVQHPNPSP
ncbi:MAG: NADP(H)-dependent aldo-keto reductase [Pedobacter sp.]|nr:NADP(H)-dependent aldo-keto reductase [Pedobacter sp.]